jgi:hypothetical protein
MNFISGLAAKFATQLIIGGVVALIAGAGFLGFKVHYTNAGYQRALDDIAADNKEAIDAGNKAVGRVRACWNAGRVWNSTEGVCAGR